MNAPMDAPARYPAPWVSLPDPPWELPKEPTVLIRNCLWTYELDEWGEAGDVWDAPLPGLLN